MKEISVFLFIFLSCAFGFSQEKGDFQWLFGYDCGDTSICGNSIMNFNTYPVIGNRVGGEIDFDHANASICDDEGNMLLSTNGRYVADKFVGLMENGDSLNLNGTLGFNSALPLPQGVLILPNPSIETLYYIIHSNLATQNAPNGLHIVSKVLYYSIVDFNANGGLGKVTEKNIPLISDTLDAGKIVATRHANGRDWWVIIPEYQTNRYYTILITPQGVENLGAQSVGSATFDGLGQSVFSPDGSKYVHMSLYDWNESYLDIYDFDRCTGKLSNHEQIFFDDYASCGGVAVSPNSRFLYLATQKSIYQFDMWENDIAATKIKVAAYDGYEELTVTASGDSIYLATFFFMAQLAPDGKIYITPNNTVKALHVINNPNLPGTACGVAQHGFELPTLNLFSMPNFPNYRLGPLDGSPCDTLGLDNHPVARYRYDQDSSDYLSVAFTDLSYYEPAEWLWDFGDGSTSQDTSPVHSFPGDGTYEVCLMVSNVNGSNTLCRTLQLGTVATGEAAPEVAVTIFPNPCREGTNITLPDYLPKNASITLYDVTGRPALRQPLLTGRNSLDLSHLPLGLYFYEIKEEGSLVKSGKLVRVE
jgi:hypothetical protein